MKIKIDEYDVNYIDINNYSDLPAVLILHGWGCNINVYIKMIDALKATYRVICLDMIGFGSTTMPDHPLDVDEYTNFIEKFIKALGLKKLSLIGHSFGGRIIIKLFSRKLKDFDFQKVVMVDAAGIKPKKKLSVTLRIMTFKFAKNLFNSTPLHKMYPNFIENMRKKAGSADYNSAAAVMRNTLVKVVNEDLTDYLETIEKPTLLVWGDKDDATPLQDAYTMDKKIQNSELFIVKGAGHYSFLEQADTVNNKIIDFLSKEV